MAWCFRHADCWSRISGIPYKAGVASWRDWAKKNGRWDNKPCKGALVIFSWGHNGSADHIGIVERVVNGSTIITIEGNTGGGNGAVMRRTRRRSDVLGYIHVTIYPPSSPSKPIAKKAVAIGTVKCFGTHGKTWWIGKKNGKRIYTDALLIKNKKATGYKGKATGKDIYATGTVFCYNTHGKGANQLWLISPNDDVRIPSGLIKNKKTI
jgi:hypothetical protein